MSSAGRVRIEIGRRFAGRETSVDLMYRSSAVFRRLCRDYVACADSLAHWQHAATEKASLHAAEYSELLEELTTEIERALLAHGP